MKVLDKQAESIGAQTELTLGTLARLGTQSEQQLPVLAEKLGNTLDSLNATALQVQETTRTNGEALREVLTQAPELVRGSGELVRDSQEIARRGAPQLAAARLHRALRDAHAAGR